MPGSFSTIIFNPYPSCPSLCCFLPMMASCVFSCHFQPLLSHFSHFSLAFYPRLTFSHFSCSYHNTSRFTSFCFDFCFFPSYILRCPSPLSLQLFFNLSLVPYPFFSCPCRPFPRSVFSLLLPLYASIAYLLCPYFFLTCSCPVLYALHTMHLIPCLQRNRM